MRFQNIQSPIATSRIADVPSTIPATKLSGVLDKVEFEDASEWRVDEEEEEVEAAVELIETVIIVAAAELGVDEVEYISLLAVVPSAAVPIDIAWAW